MNEVNQRLRSAVELAGIRRPELASLLGVSVTTVNGWFSSLRMNQGVPSIIWKPAGRKGRVSFPYALWTPEAITQIGAD